MNEQLLYDIEVFLGQVQADLENVRSFYLQHQAARLQKAIGDYYRQQNNASGDESTQSEAIDALWSEMKLVQAKGNEVKASEACQLVFFGPDKFKRAIASWLGRYRVTPKNAPSSPETPKSTILDATYCDSCGLNTELESGLCVDCSKLQASKNWRPLDFSKDMLGVWD